MCRNEQCHSNTATGYYRCKIPTAKKEASVKFPDGMHQNYPVNCSKLTGRNNLWVMDLFPKSLIFNKVEKKVVFTKEIKYLELKKILQSKKVPLLTIFVISQTPASTELKVVTGSLKGRQHTAQ